MPTKAIAHTALLGSLGLVAPMVATAQAASSPAPSWSSSEAELCFGQVPTIVGTPGEVLVGTAGPDVVVTNGSWGANTLGGDDLLCLTGTTGIPNQVDSEASFDTGERSDRIDATGGYFPMQIYIIPGPGPDQVVGGPHKKDGGEIDGVDVTSGGDADTDIIQTGRGQNRVSAGGTMLLT